MLRLFLWLTFFSLQTGAQLAGPMADNIFKNITVRSQGIPDEFALAWGHLARPGTGGKSGQQLRENLKPAPVLKNYQQFEPRQNASGEVMITTLRIRQLVADTKSMTMGHNPDYGLYYGQIGNLQKESPCRFKQVEKKSLRAQTPGFRPQEWNYVGSREVPPMVGTKYAKNSEDLKTTTALLFTNADGKFLELECKTPKSETSRSIISDHKELLQILNSITGEDGKPVVELKPAYHVNATAKNNSNSRSLPQSAQSGQR